VFGAVPIPATAPAPKEDADEPEEGPRRRWPWFALSLLVLALIALMVFAFTREERANVPKVTGLQLLEARERLDNAGFERVDVERERSPAEVDRVLRQDPDPGEEASRDDAVKLIVSAGPGKVRVPSVRNTQLELAIRELEKQGLKVTADQQASSSVKKGFAIGTSPEEGTEVDRGSRVRLFVSSGPAKITVPDVVGLSREAAESRLTREGLDPDVETRQSDQPEDEVISQSPAAGSQLDRGARVTITISEGRKQVQVPNVVGLSVSDARRVLRGEGLGATVRERTTTDEGEDGQVVDQRPGVGAEVDEGRSVIVIVGRFEEPSSPDPNSSPPAASP
jgi:serine/threonine-protein kinase